ncbi:aminopeptidase [Tengunoibacter tsumagoiensis]|uniref:Aminopeptidase n=1 Tax=Tengunoibacter tsumagoiensis TaxID=2014871 RepID=A0A402A9R6_9CHLR|nr:aminopeptidase [Tengunoibacter tsumagoiensis]GCE15695.1 aminopeptidase [Tengunoibacter tsumagoiensis]
MVDARILKLAEILVDHSLKVQPDEKVILASSILGRPLIMEMLRLITRKGAEGILDITFSEMPDILLSEMPEDRLDQIPEIVDYIYRHTHCLANIYAPEQAIVKAEIPLERKQRARRAMQSLRQHVLSDMRWVLCNYPTPDLAKEAGMSMEDYERFFFDACLIDWTELEQQLAKLQEYTRKASVVEILTPDTQLTLSLEGRSSTIGAGIKNMPDGEIFWPPVETLTEGTIYFDVPLIYDKHEVSGIELTFAAGKVVQARAEQGEAFLLSVLDTDEGARTLGEFGIGCNYGIKQYSKSILFDEKIGGTIHLALGANVDPAGGGKNTSSIHWDLIKDLRKGGVIKIDGEVIQQDGKFTIA